MVLSRRTLIYLSLFALFMALSTYSKVAYNEFVDRLHLLDVAKEKVDIEMKRRTDLDRRSWDAARLYMDTEHKIYDALLELNGLIETGQDDEKRDSAGREIRGLLQSMEVLKEAYPALKSARPYEYLMDTIKASGWRVTSERLVYNRMIYGFNMTCDKFPENIFAWLYGFRNVPYFKAIEGAKRRPEIRELRSLLPL